MEADHFAGTYGGRTNRADRADTQRRGRQSEGEPASSSMPSCSIHLHRSHLQCVHRLHGRRWSEQQRRTLGETVREACRGGRPALWLQRRRFYLPFLPCIDVVHFVVHAFHVSHLFCCCDCPTASPRLQPTMLPITVWPASAPASTWPSSTRSDRPMSSTSRCVGGAAGATWIGRWRSVEAAERFAFRKLAGMRLTRLSFRACLCASSFFFLLSSLLVSFSVV